MSIQGISHITFVVKDLERAKHFFCDGLSAEEVYDSSAKNFLISKEKFFVLGGVWIAVMEGEPRTDRTYRHVAFQTTDDELPRLEDRLRTIGVEIKPSRARVRGEGQSMYFYDFDDNLFELHTGTLEQRLDHYEKDEYACSAGSTAFTKCQQQRVGRKRMPYSEEHRKAVCGKTASTV